MDLDLFLSDSLNYQPQNETNKNQQPQQIIQQISKNQQKQLTRPADLQSTPQSPLLNDNLSASNVDSSKKLGSILAGKKARQKKKVYVESLEFKIKQMQNQVTRYQQEIRKTKQTLSKMLQSAKYNQNSLTYSQIETLIQSQDPNEDRINLLLDMIRFRVGGCGNERNAKIQYFVKQLMNALYPPFQRYLMYCCDKNYDIFQQPNIDQLFDVSTIQPSKNMYIEWTRQFWQSLSITQSQKRQILKFRSIFIKKKEQSLKIINEILETNLQIKQNEKLYQIMISQIRSKLNPVQGAVWVLFSDRIRYKRQIILDSQKQLYSTIVPIYLPPHKKIKKE